MEKLKKYLLLFLLIFIIGCTSKYDVVLSEISFDHDGTVDIISYIAENPTNYNLTCELNIKLEGENDILETFEINSDETKQFSTRVKLPPGETKVILSTRCKPIN